MASHAVLATSISLASAGTAEGQVNRRSRLVEKHRRGATRPEQHTVLKE